MKNFKVKQEPYISMVFELTDSIEYNVDRKALTFDNNFMRYLAKSTGLKSNKSRIIKKRAKQVLTQALKKGFEEQK